MKKQLLIIGIIAFLICSGLSGCTETNNQNVFPPSIITFSITPYTIKEGQTAELSWKVKNATLIFIDNGIGNVSLIGNRIITPTITTTYKLTARNEDKETHATCHIIVTKIDYNLMLVGTWNLTLGKLGLYYPTMAFYADRTARIGTMNSAISGGWDSYSDFIDWNVNNDTLIMLQETLDGKVFTWNWTIRFDGNTFTINSEQFFPSDWESKYEKIP